MKQLAPIVWALAIIVGVGGPCLVICVVYAKVPEWRLHPRARRVYRDDKDRIKSYRLRLSCPEAFPEGLVSPVDVAMQAKGPLPADSTRKDPP